MIHPKKGSPSGRNAYPVTEKIEELKKKDIDKFKMEQEKKYTKRTMDTLRSAIITAMKTFRDGEFAESICRYKRRK